MADLDNLKQCAKAYDAYEKVYLAHRISEAVTEIERLRAALIASRPYVAKAADSFGSDWAAIETLNKIDAALNNEQTTAKDEK